MNKLNWIYCISSGFTSV